MNVLYIVGNRPQFVKLAVLHQEMAKHPFIKESIIHTGQHYSAEMSDVFFNELAIEIPIVNLKIHSISAIAMIGRTMEALEIEIRKQNPDVIVVFGDTNATLAGALVAKKMMIPLFHIEAGIRTLEEEMPEESNRYLTDRLADVNFCCTYLGIENLRKEGFSGNTIHSTVINSGDLMLDAYEFYFDRFIGLADRFIDLSILKNKYTVCTIHRKQNTDCLETLTNIAQALNEINKEIPVVCPLHPNTKNLIDSNNIHCEFTIITPVGYLDMQFLLHHADYVITDSGGVQREAFFAQKPTLIVMEKPFWPEILQFGCALNCSGDKQQIVDSFYALKKKNRVFDKSVFGKGYAAENITKSIVEYVRTLQIKSDNRLK